MTVSVLVGSFEALSFIRLSPLTCALGPRYVIFASKDAIQQILVEKDLIKAPEYAWFRVKPEITNLLNERDRIGYRQKVCGFVISGICPIVSIA